MLTLKSYHDQALWKAREDLPKARPPLAVVTALTEERYQWMADSVLCTMRARRVDREPPKCEGTIRHFATWAQLNRP